MNRKTPARHRKNGIRLLAPIVGIVAMVLGGTLAFAVWGSRIGIATDGTAIVAGSFSLTLGDQGWQWADPGHLAPGQSATATHSLIFEGTGANLRTNLTVRPTIVPNDPGTAPLPRVAWAIAPSGNTPVATDYRTGEDTLAGIEPGIYVLFVKFSVPVESGLPNGHLDYDSLVRSVALNLQADQTRTVPHE